MSLTRHLFAGVAIATVASTQAASVEIGGAAVAASAAKPLELSTETYIAGVPVFNYDKAFSGDTTSAQTLGVGEAGDIAAHENWIVALEPGDRGDAIKSMCSLSKTGCTVTGDSPGFPFIALRGTEGELASVVEHSREISRFIDVDLTMRPPPLEFSLRGEKEVQVAEGRGETSLWNLFRIGANKSTMMGAGVHVYVTDTGIRTDHVEFGGRAIAWLDMFNDTHTATRFCNVSTDDDCAGDVYGHGTHCAGTIAGETYGVAPQAMVYSVKVLSDEGPGPTSGIIYSMGMIAQQGLRPAIVSMSLGGGRNYAYKAAVDELVHAGVTVVVAAGNEYTDACTKSPAFAPSAITVGATTSTDARSYFSNFGPCVDIWAPGSAILSCDSDRRNGRVVPNNASVEYQGTSMACPHVAGAAALLLEKDATMSPGQVRDSLRGKASENYITDLGPLDENLFLYVGSDGPQPRLPPQDLSSWPSDEFFQVCDKNGQDGPMGDFPVCRCRKRADWNPVNGTRCYDGLKLGCPIGALAAHDNNPNNPLTHWYYEMNCTTCFCLEEAPEDSQAPGPQLPYVLIISVTVAVALAGVAFYAYYVRVQPEKQSDPLTVEVAA